MKHLLLSITFLLLSVAAVAQEKLLEIVPSSFAPVQTDMISGVGIDKIAPDLSRRPCARIKMHINRMTAEEIGKLSVRPVGGNVVVMKQVVATEGNGLIVELTAKEPTRFYLHHDKYGDSNEVSLNLQGNKEYKLEAQLNITYPIAIFCNARNSEVYLDGIFKGRIDEKYSLTIGEVFPGVHKLKVVSGAVAKEEEIMVDNQHIHFRVNIPLEKAEPQYVVFQVEPKSAIVRIDDKDYTPDEHGQITDVLSNGSYRYSVSAKYYHTESGTFVVDGKKIEKNVKLSKAYGWLKVSGAGNLEGASVFVDDSPRGSAPTEPLPLASGKHTVRIVQKLYKTLETEVTIKDNETLTFSPNLVADYANVTLIAAEGCQIYVNGQYKGTARWSGSLATGTYIFEARKTGHNSSKLTKTIAATPSKQSFVIPPPQAILGTLNIKSSPAMADIYIDSKLVGRTPMMHQCIIGSHTVSIRKSGFNSKEKRVTVAEGKTTTINEMLSKKSTTAPKPSYSTRKKPSYSSSYSTHKKPSYSSSYSTNKKPSSSYSSSYSSKKYKKSDSWDSFNLGAYMGFGGSAVMLKRESGTTSFDFNFGGMLRMWNHLTLFNAMVGFGYMYTKQINFIEIPAIVNWNFVRDEALDISSYMGIGTEVTFAFANVGIYEKGKAYLDCPIVFQLGFGLRHIDCALYTKLFTQHNLAMIGVRATYYF